MDGGEELSGGLVVADGDRPKLLELGKAVFDQMEMPAPKKANGVRRGKRPRACNRPDLMSVPPPPG